MTRLRLESGPLNLESSALIVKPPLPQAGRADLTFKKTHFGKPPTPKLSFTLKWWTSKAHEKNSQSSPYNELTVSNLEDKNKNLKKNCCVRPCILSPSLFKISCILICNEISDFFKFIFLSWPTKLAKKSKNKSYRRKIDLLKRRQLPSFVPDFLSNFCCWPQSLLVTLCQVWK